MGLELDLPRYSIYLFWNGDEIRETEDPEDLSGSLGPHSVHGSVDDLDRRAGVVFSSVAEVEGVSEVSVGHGRKRIYDVGRCLLEGGGVPGRRERVQVGRYV